MYYVRLTNDVIYFHGLAQDCGTSSNGVSAALHLAIEFILEKWHYVAL